MRKVGLLHLIFSLSYLHETGWRSLSLKTPIWLMYLLRPKGKQMGCGWGSWKPRTHSTLETLYHLSKDTKYANDPLQKFLQHCFLKHAMMILSSYNVLGSVYILMLIQHPYIFSIFFCSIFFKQIRKLKGHRVKWFTQNHKASKKQRSNPDSLAISFFSFHCITAPLLPSGHGLVHHTECQMWEDDTVVKKKEKKHHFTMLQPLAMEAMLLWKHSSPPTHTHTTGRD